METLCSEHVSMRKTRYDVLEGMSSYVLPSRMAASFGLKAMEPITCLYGAVGPDKWIESVQKGKPELVFSVCGKREEI